MDVRGHFKEHGFINVLGWCTVPSWMGYSVYRAPCSVTDREGKGSLVNGAFNKWTKISDTLVGKKGHAIKTYHSNAVAAMDS